MAENAGTGTRGYGRNPKSNEAGVSNISTRKENDRLQTERLMEDIVETGNMMDAYKRVLANKGAPGIDGMTVYELEKHLARHWRRIKEELLTGNYKPQAVLQVEIPKPDGGVRKLGIPTVTDRLIQQAMYQIFEPSYDPQFSEASFGFRKGRSPQDAVKKSMEYIHQGRTWVVDIDLEKFFDRVNHDILMAMIAKRIKDKRVLRLLRRCLQSGIMVDGVVTARIEGTPQGSPISPLLSNIILDVMDKEIEKRGHPFCRYADDCNVYVRTERAGIRVMESLARFLDRKLKLKVNEKKSKVDRPWKLKFLGYTTTPPGKIRLKPAPKAVERFKEKTRELLRKGRGRSLEKTIFELAPRIRGWYQYFKLSEVKTIFEELDGWIRRKLRCNLWRQWKRPKTREKKLLRRGLDRYTAWKSANNGHGAWWNAGAQHMNFAFPKKFFDKLKLVSMLDLKVRIV
jgi:RNA-directed DNA polymerase